MRGSYLALILLMGVVMASVGAQQPPAEQSSQTKPAAKKDTTVATVASTAFNQALLRPATLQAKAPDVYEVKFTTTKGDFVVKVTRTWAPLGADRFYNLVKNGFYDQCTLFRVVPGFVVQFGISAHPQVSRAWLNAVIKDDPVKQSNKRGTVTFATGGPNTRTTQVFINLADRNAFLDSQGFSPFGEVKHGMDVVAQFYSGYGEGTTNRQGEIMQGGSAFLTKNFPKLDSIKSATILAGSEAAPPAKKAGTAPAETPTKKAP